MGAETRQRIAEAWPDILERVRNGARVDRTCEHYSINRGQLWQYWSFDPERRAQWYDALKESAEAFFDKALDAAENAGKDAKAARVQIAAYQWIAEKRDPERFGQRTRADINVKSVDLTKIIQDANARLAAAKQGRVIEGSFSNTGDDNIRAHTQQALTAEILKAADLY